MCVCVCVCDNDFISFGYTPRSGIFNFLRNLHTAFHCGYASLHSHQLCPRVPFAPHSHQNSLPLVFWAIAILTGVRWLWFCFAFPWLLVTLSTFSCYSWPFVYLPWKNVYIGIFPFFNWVVYFITIEFCKFLVYFGYQYFIEYVVC